MQNDNLLNTLSIIYNYARRLDQVNKGAASYGVQDYSTEDLVKYDLLNILSYLCTYSRENDLNINVISDIIGESVTYTECRNSAINDNIDGSILTIVPVSFQILVNADIDNGVTSLENDRDAASSYAYTLFMAYLLAAASIYKNCTIENLQQKNKPLYDFLFGLQDFIQESIRNSSMPQINPDTGTIDSNSFSVDPRTGEILIIPPSARSNRTNNPAPRSSAPTPPTTSITSRSVPASPQTYVPAPAQEQDENPSFLDRIVNFFKDLFS